MTASSPTASPFPFSCHLLVIYLLVPNSRLLSAQSWSAGLEKDFSITPSKISFRPLRLCITVAKLWHIWRVSQHWPPCEVTVVTRRGHPSGPANATEIPVVPRRWKGRGVWAEGMKPLLLLFSQFSLRSLWKISSRMWGYVVWVVVFFSWPILPTSHLGSDGDLKLVLLFAFFFCCLFTGNMVSSSKI